MEIRMEGTESAAVSAVSLANCAQTAVIRLEEQEQVNILHPRQIIAFQGQPSLREDRPMNLKGMYRKKKLIQAGITGPSELMMALPQGFFLKTVSVDESAGLLFEFRHLLFYTSGIRMQTVMQSFKHMLVTKDWMKMQFTGSGSIGILSHGPVHEIQLKVDTPLYVDAGCLLALPERAKLELCVYGNHLASQHMNYQWKITGLGPVLLQTHKSDPHLEADMRGDGLIKRVLREVIPFGSVFIK